jgi:amidase
VVPVGFRPDGLPLAVQLVGPPDSELLLLSVAGQFELQNPWQRHAIV